MTKIKTETTTIETITEAPRLCSGCRHWVNHHCPSLGTSCQLARPEVRDGYGCDAWAGPDED